MKILFVVPYPVEGPSSRFRVWQYLPYLRRQGIEATVSPFLSSSAYHIIYKKGHWLCKFVAFLRGFRKRILLLRRASAYDIVFIQREAFPWGPPVFERILHSLNKNIVFDFDDAIFLPSFSSENRAVRFLKFPEKTGQIIKMSRLVIAGNNYLANYARKFNQNVEILPTPVDTRLFRPREQETHGPVVIGWIGSTTTARFLSHIEEALRKIHQRFSDRIEIKIVGAGSFRFRELIVQYKDWTLNEELRDLQSFEVGIMPMPDDPWTRGKCGFKALQYMSVGIPAVCSAVGVNREIILDGVNGFLAETEEDWLQKLSSLIEDPKLRVRVGQKAREWVEERYSLELWSQQLVTLLTKVQQTNAGKNED